MCKTVRYLVIYIILGDHHYITVCHMLQLVQILCRFTFKYCVKLSLSHMVCTIIGQNSIDTSTRFSICEVKIISIIAYNEGIEYDKMSRRSRLISCDFNDKH
eukprot:315037_1